MNMKCSCGCTLPPNHSLGSFECFRERVRTNPIKVKGDDRWFVDGGLITGFTLREQRGYHQHSCGGWSRPKDHESTNSLPDET